MTSSNPPDSPPPTHVTGEPPRSPELPTHPHWRRRAGVFAVLLWIAVFAAGILIPSGTAREVLGWKAAEKPGDKITAIENKISELEAGDARQDEDELPTASKPIQEDRPAVDPAGVGSSESKAAGKSSPPASGPAMGTFSAFFVAAIAFIPINVAMLCVIAGFIGGCSVSEELIRDVRMDVDNQKESPSSSPSKRRLNFLTEHPAFSAIRGLVVFLLISSGLFVFAGSELLIESGSQEEALGNYIKFAGIFSFFAYFAGHDPTVFSAMLRFGGNRLATDPPP